MKTIYAKTAESVRQSNPEPGDIVITGVKGRNLPGTRVVVDTDPYTEETVLRPEWCSRWAVSKLPTARRAVSDESETLKCSQLKMENMILGAARQMSICRFCRWNTSRHSMRAADMLHDVCRWYNESILNMPEFESFRDIVEYMQSTRPWRERFNKAAFPWRRMRINDD